jgi:hypothetical protein
MTVSHHWRRRLGACKVVGRWHIVEVDSWDRHLDRWGAGDDYDR